MAELPSKPSIPKREADNLMANLFDYRDLT
jgi:hypothetical protein